MCSQRAPQNNCRYVILKIRYANRNAGEVRLVWGIDGWHALPEECLPEGSERNIRGAVCTPMCRKGQYFEAAIRIPEKSKLDYGFLVTEDAAGRTVYHWDEDTRRKSVVLRWGSLLLRLKSFLELQWFNAWQASPIPYHPENRTAGLQTTMYSETPYTRFIILAHGRTGSSLLTTLLDSHPQIIAFSELFHKDDAARNRMSEAVGKGIGENENPAWYLNTHVFRTYPDEIRAAGFKMLYGHAGDPPWQLVWEYLQSSRVSVVHLKRRNLLDRYLSSRLASRSQLWEATSLDDVEPYNIPITIDPDACMEDIFNTLHEQVKYDHIFRENPLHEV